MEHEMYIGILNKKDKGSYTDYLINLTRKLQFFEKLVKENQSEEIHRLCCEVMEISDYPQGSIIVKFGDKGNSFYIILEGTVGFYLPDSRRSLFSIKPMSDKEFVNKSKNNSLFKRTSLEDFSEVHTSPNPVFAPPVLEEVSRMGPGESFGEFALISNKPRAATVIALTAVTVAILNKKDFKNLIEKFSKKKLLEKLAFFEAHPMFLKCTKQSLMKLSYYFITRHINKGEYLYRSGDIAEGIFFVKSGEFLITKLLELPRLGYNNKVTELNKRFRQLNYYKKVDLFYKSISEIIGLQEVLDEAETRQFSCLCVSPNTEDLMSRIPFTESWKFLWDKHQRDSFKIQARLEEILEVEKAKISLDITPLRVLRSQTAIKSKSSLNLARPADQTINKKVSSCRKIKLPKNFRNKSSS